MNLQQRRMIEDIRALIRYHQVLGIKDYPWHCETPHFIDGMSETPARDAGMLPPPEKLPIPPVMVRETLADIDAEIQGCCQCELHAGRLIAVAGRGRARARLLIVGGWLAGSGEAVPLPGVIFGLEQDRMVTRMMEAIQLQGDDVFVTNILKCGLPESCQPQASHLQCCLGYLRRQIAVIGPEVICSMGIIATRALLGLPQSLSQLRGRFHSYSTLDGRQIPVMPTYHPSYLLQAEEMKKETWKDLQLIQKRLKG